MSLPWILTDHVLSSANLSLMESIFFPLDIYNDAAHRCLHTLQQKFLFDEIEAEVNLCFDQLVFKLSSQIFLSFKTRAASVLLDKEFKSCMFKEHPAVKLGVPKSRDEVLLRMRHFQVILACSYVFLWE